MWSARRSEPRGERRERRVAHDLFAVIKRAAGDANRLTPFGLGREAALCPPLSAGVVRGGSFPTWTHVLRRGHKTPSPSGALPIYLLVLSSLPQANEELLSALPRSAALRCADRGRICRVLQQLPARLPARLRSPPAGELLCTQSEVHSAVFSRRPHPHQPSGQRGLPAGAAGYPCHQLRHQRIRHVVVAPDADPAAPRVRAGIVFPVPSHSAAVSSRLAAAGTRHHSPDCGSAVCRAPDDLGRDQLPFGAVVIAHCRISPPLPGTVYATPASRFTGEIPGGCGGPLWSGAVHEDRSGRRSGGVFLLRGRADGPATSKQHRGCRARRSVA